MKIFLSYARQDIRRAEEIAEAFKQLGHDVWFDYDLSPGQAYDQAIHNELTSSDMVAVLWSKTSVGSMWVRSEAEVARAGGKLLAIGLEKVDLPPPYNLYQLLDVSQAHGAQLRNLLAGAMPGAERRAAAAKQRPAPPIPPPPLAPPPPSQFAPSPQPAPQQAPAASPAAPSAAPRPFDVFISYSRKDEAACKALFDLLVQRGLNPWFDKDIGSGAFKQKIFERISSVQVFALLLSKNSTGSTSVSKELSMASQAGRLIVPISIDGTEAADLRDTFAFELVELNIFPVAPDNPATWTAVVDTIEASVRELSATTPSPRPPAVVVEPPSRSGGGTIFWTFIAAIWFIAQLAMIGFGAQRFLAVDLVQAALISGASSIVVLPLTAATAALFRIAFRSSK